MAPTKKDASASDKEAKLSPEQSASLILDYLRKQNRPYSATDISSNLKNRVTKAAAAKLLKDMHERNEIEGRAAGKQIVYHVIQDEPSEKHTEDLQEMEVATKSLQESTLALKAEEKALRISLREGASQIPIAELKSSVAALEEQKAEMTARLVTLTSGNVKPVSLEERERVNTEHRKWQKTANARKKIRVELWKEIEGAIEKDKAEETKEELGLEF